MWAFARVRICVSSECLLLTSVTIMARFTVTLSLEVEADTEQDARYWFADTVCEGGFDTRSLKVSPIEKD